MADAVVDAGLDHEAPVEAYANYNKSTHRVALVGNWVEERALEADTGVFRYKVRADPLPPRAIPPAPRQKITIPSPRTRRLARPLRASCVGSKFRPSSSSSSFSHPPPVPLSVPRTCRSGSNPLPRTTRACTRSPSARPPR